jgi:Na+-translocating ferredoxin:NAD+ oxidoreductase RnfG subunit
MTTLFRYFFSRKPLRSSGLIFACALMIFSISFPGIGLAEEEKFKLQVYLTKKQALDIAFPGADKVEKEKQWLTDEQKQAIGKLCLQTIKERRFTFYVGKRNGKPMGYMLIHNIIGKSFPITFMTVLDPDGTVRDVEIMVYREPRGWEVRNESFLSQFFGKDSSTDSREINSITGATLSVTAITTGVYKAMAAYKVLYLQN